ncbi:MAG: glycerophosphodiester phosphodiesterase family protein [Promethearchaeota archaeon]
MNDIHERSFLAFTWDVNDEENMERVLKMGVDAIYSNYPDKAISLLEKLRL